MYVLGSLVLAPIAVYLVVRMGTYAYLMSQYKFRQNHPEPEKESENVES